ncbi:MAG: magnesium/cobalt transporter CorA [Phycisphaera sp.]|nr:magnesium/cobalt transporter CorA [Phycisphaera sp.]
MSDDRQTGAEPTATRDARGGRRSVGSAIDNAVGAASGAVGAAGRLLGSALRLPGLRKHRHPSIPHPVAASPGSRPGIESVAEAATPPEPGDVVVRVIDYSPDRVEMIDVDDLDAFLAHAHKPDWATVRWVNVDGLHPYVVKRVTETYGIHTLAAEDVVRVPQRPKIEPYDDDLFFIVARMLMLTEERLVAEQISFFYRPGLLVSFQEFHGDIWQPIRNRLETTGTRIRSSGADYLLYALLDAVVDHCFPILEHYGDLMQSMEDDILEDPSPEMLSHLHGIKRQLATLRRVMWPLRDVVDTLHRDESERMSKTVQTYMRDVYDHAVQVIDIIETYREMAGGLTDLYMSAVSNRMNEVMKVLTIIATIFIPITFLAGIYGMNFDVLPELHWKWSYAMFWVVTFSIAGGMLVFFRRRGWL